MYESVSISQLKALIGKVNIIDIRDNYVYNLENIPTSKNIPMNFLLNFPENYLDKNNKYYIYCTFGRQSVKVCMELTKKGYNVINIVGGFNNYKDYN